MPTILFPRLANGWGMTGTLTWHSYGGNINFTARDVINRNIIGYQSAEQEKKSINMSIVTFLNPVTPNIST